MKFKVFVGISIICAVVLSSCFIVDDASKAARGISSRTLNADNILQNYEYFYATYTEAKSKVNVYNNYTKQIKDETDLDMKNRMRVEQNGVYNYIAMIIGDYNAKSLMQNRALFKAKDLPYQMEFNVIDGVAIIRDL